MNNFLYYIIIIPISNLNNFFLYLVSDILYIIIGKLLKYRKPLITKNLEKSFPKKNENEIKNIRRYFYKHFSDLIVESLKGFTISEKRINKKIKLKNTIIIETGGMKGKRKEMIKSELHEILKSGFGTKNIQSEYGMTELLSQAYSKKNGIFKCPKWMKIFIRDINDANNLNSNKKTGGINIIDLANIYSCSFIATDDLGKMVAESKFEVLGRIDNSDIRGCNLLI